MCLINSLMGNSCGGVRGVVEGGADCRLTASAAHPYRVALILTQRGDCCRSLVQAAQPALHRVGLGRASTVAPRKRSQKLGLLQALPFAARRFNVVAIRPLFAMSPTSTPTASSAASTGKAVRMFGRFQLLRLLGKSARTMVWHCMDTRNQLECMLDIPREKPSGGALSAWLQAVKRGARLNHPQLAQALEVGEHDQWPYALYERAQWVTWTEKMSSKGLPPAEVAQWTAQAARGLAFAHEAGISHQDLQLFHLLLDDDQNVCIMGLEVASRAQTADVSVGLDALRASRHAAEDDVLALGLILHHALAGQPALDEADVSQAMSRMAPRGAEFVRLPWALPRPVPDPLRAIVNRATDRQEKQRYLTARSLQRALEGWLSTLSDQNGGPLAILMDRLRSVGVLPAMPGGAERVAHLALLEKGRTNELAAIVLEDLALTYELLRMVNTAQLRSGSVSSDGPVLMLRRAISMVGLEGVRRAALSLRSWPGPMSEKAAEDMERLILRVKRAGRIATRLAPAGYDPEVVALITSLQNLGRMMVQYHFPEEALQIRRLMHPNEAVAGTSAEQGMTAEAAAFAVLGTDLEALGVAVVRQWGFDEAVLSMIRRFPTNTGLKSLEGDSDLLRATASCANEVLEALALPPKRVGQALNNVVSRYARALGISAKDIQDAIQAESSSNGTVSAAPGMASA
ncbi:MAG: protein kinase [Ideonella sp. MAG2]|nr:MAG: protein kinase [Ideonella sp. MAG2]